STPATPRCNLLLNHAKKTGCPGRSSRFSLESLAFSCRCDRYALPFIARRSRIPTGRRITIGRIAGIDLRGTDHGLGLDLGGDHPGRGPPRVAQGVREQVRPSVLGKMPAIDAGLLDRILWWVAAVVSYIVLVGLTTLAIQLTRTP